MTVPIPRLACVLSLSLMWALMWASMWACASRGPGSGRSDSAPENTFADVIAVQATGDPGDYLFSVAISSPDSGCERYADWWEIMSMDGHLLYRRILAHSHVDEQPFTRSGGPVTIGVDDVVLLRAHMNPGGYGRTVMRGTVASGFVETPVPAGFAARLADMQPLPDGCAF